MFADVAYAMAQSPGGGGGGAEGQQPGMGQMFTLFLPMILIFYFLLIRPQQKRAKDQAAMLKALQKGDDVVTTGGIHGKITNLADHVVTLEVAPNVRIRVSRENVAGKESGKESKEKASKQATPASTSN